jgi:hypothetical protein
VKIHVEEEPPVKRKSDKRQFADGILQRGYLKGDFAMSPARLGPRPASFVPSD